MPQISGDTLMTLNFKYFNQFYFKHSCITGVAVLTKYLDTHELRGLIILDF